LLVIQKGHIQVNGEQAQAVELVQFEREGNSITLESESASRVLALSGEPLGEPVAGQGPFVMITQEEIQEAIQDYQAGKMGHLI